MAPLNSASLSLKLGRAFLVASFTVEFIAQARCAALFGQHPRARHKRGVMPHMLRVAAVQYRAPVAFVVPVVSCDAPLHLFLSRI